MGASNSAKSAVLRDRLEELLNHCDPSLVDNYRGRFSREWFATRIGCSAKTLTQNPHLRLSLTRWEEQHAPQMVRRVAEGAEKNENVVRIRNPQDGGSILKVDAELGKYQSRSYTIPTLMWNDGLDEWVSDYARHLVVWEKNKPSSVEQAVKVLRIFRRLQRGQRIANDRVDDELLLSWQNQMRTAGAKVERRNFCVSTVHGFYKWAEQQGLVKYQVQVKSRHDYTEISDGYVFPLKSDEITVRLPGGGSYTRWVSKLLEPGETSSYGNRHTPTPSEVEALLSKAETSGRNGARNLLMLQVALETGARVSEIVQLKTSDFPDPEHIGAMLEQDAYFIEVKVVRKNQGEGVLRFNKDLALSIIAFLYHDPQRQAIVDTLPRHALKNDQAVFLSEQGAALTEDSVTRIGGMIFAAAGVKKANIHRLRARFICEVIELQLDRLSEEGVTVVRSEAWENQILVMAVELMGHSHPMSLRPYLNEILQRRMTKGGKIEPRSIEAREQSIERLRRQLGQQVVRHAKLAEAERLMAEGKGGAAAAILKEIAGALEQ